MADNVHVASSKSGGNPGTGSYAPRQEVPREAAQEAPSYSAGSNEDFAVIDDGEDLPF